VTFGDDGPDDAFTAGAAAAPEQVARRLHEYRRFFEPAVPDWHRLDPDARDVAVAIAAAVLDWLRREGTAG
jgi:hypothetical protein